MDADGDGATLMVGQASGGMLRILVEQAGAEIPVESEPGEVGEIARGPRFAERVRPEDRGGASGEGPWPNGGRR